MHDPVWDRVGTLCKQLGRWPQLRQIIGDSAGGASLAELARALAASAEPDLTLLAGLLDEIEDAGARAGVPGITGVGTRADGTGSGYKALPPGMSGGVGVIAWTCPLRRCARVVLRGEVAGPPVCFAGSSETPMAPYTTESG